MPVDHVMSHRNVLHNRIIWNCPGLLGEGGHSLSHPLSRAILRLTLLTQSSCHPGTLLRQVSAEEAVHLPDSSHTSDEICLSCSPLLWIKSIH